MDFKIIFPLYYQIEDIFNDSMCIHIVVEDGRIFYASLHTLVRVQTILQDKERGKHYFRDDDLIVVNDLSKETIKKVATELVADDVYGFGLRGACSLIGTIQTVYDCYPQYQSFEDLPDMTHLYDD